MAGYSGLVSILEKIVSLYPYYVLGIDYRGRVLYYTNRGGFNTIWALDPRDGSSKRLVDEPVLWVSEVSRDAKKIVFTRDVSRGREQQYIGEIDLVSDRVYIHDYMEPMRVFGLAVEGDSIVFTGATMREIGLYMIRRGSVERLATLEAFASVSDIRGDMVVGSGVLKRNPRSSEIFVYRLSENRLDVYTPREGSVNNSPVVLWDGTVMFQSSYRDPDRKVLVRLHPNEGRFEDMVFRHRDLEAYGPVEYLFYRDFGESIVVVGKREGRSRVFIDGREVPTPPGMVLNAYLYRDSLYYTYTNMFRPPRIMVYRDGENREILGSVPDRELEERFGSVEFTYIESLDGLRIPVYIARSRGYEETRTAVVYIHGGPWSEVADSWSVMIASLVAAGFNVVAPNFRGSTGYGERFRLMDIGDPGGGDLLDIEAAARYARERGLGERLFVMGYSYGGYMTLWSMFSRPDLFDCGVAGAAVADWEEMYEISDAVFRSFIEILFGGRRDLLRERSPITRAENLSRPLCIIQPQNDTRTPLRPVMKLMNRLLELGKSFEAHIVPDMGHVINTIEDAIKILLPGLVFFKRCLEKTPGPATS